MFRQTLVIAVLAALLFSTCNSQETNTTTDAPTTTTSPTTTNTSAPGSTTTDVPITTTTAAPITTAAPTTAPTPAPGGLFPGNTDYSEAEKFGISTATFSSLTLVWCLFCFVYAKVSDKLAPEPQGPKYAIVPEANKI